VTWFLQAHPFLAPLLLKVHRKIFEYFGSSPEVALEVVTDPEGMDDRELFVFICTGLPPDEALSRLDQLDKEWWRDEETRLKANSASTWNSHELPVVGVSHTCTRTYRASGKPGRSGSSATCRGESRLLCGVLREPK